MKFSWRYLDCKPIFSKPTMFNVKRQHGYVPVHNRYPMFMKHATITKPWIIFPHWIISLWFIISCRIKHMKGIILFNNLCKSNMLHMYNVHYTIWHTSNWSVNSEGKIFLMLYIKLKNGQTSGTTSQHYNKNDHIIPLYTPHAPG